MKRLKKVRGHKLIKVPEIQVPKCLILNLEMQAAALIEMTLKPSFVSAAAENCLPFITDIYFKWEDYYFYFCAGYQYPASPLAASGSCITESQFARLEYVGDIRFNLSYMSRSGKWEKIFIDLTIDECMEAIKNESFFYPLPK